MRDVVSKKQLWLAVVGLAVGAIVAYLQTDRSAPAPAPKPPVAPAANMAPAGQPRRLPAAEPLPPVTLGAAPVAPARLPKPAVVPQPIPVSPPPAPPAPPSVPMVASTYEDAGQALSEPLSGFLTAADNPVWDLPLLPEDGKLWTRSIYLDAKPSAADQKLSFVNKKPESDPLQTLTFTNMTDVGTQYPLIKNGGTTFLGRVAGGLSRDYAGLAEGQRIPEVLFGCQFEHQLTQRQKILGGGGIRPRRNRYGPPPRPHASRLGSFARCGQESQSSHGGFGIFQQGPHRRAGHQSQLHGRLDLEVLNCRRSF